MTKRILIVEDEKSLARVVSLELRQEGYEVEVKHDGRSGLETALQEDYDLILLDLVLPELDGFELMRRLQLEKTPYIIMMTARDSEMDVVTGLDHGADNYITKPFATEELLARVRAIFRRQELYEAQYCPKKLSDSRELRLDVANRTAVRGNQHIPLSRREFDLLNALLSNVNQVMTREALLKEVWDHTGPSETNVVDVYVRYLRGKIDISGQESYIKTVRGLGYIIREQ